MIAIAGHETTASLIGNATLALIDHPEVLEEVRSTPSLVSRYVGDCLRYDPPVPYTVRVASEDVDVGGTAVKRGESVAAFIAAANHDPAVFANPEQLVLSRPTEPANVGFGHGIHACIGSLLARVEAECALGALLPRLQSDRPRPAVTRRTSVAVRGLATFPLHLSGLETSDRHAAQP